MEELADQMTHLQLSSRTPEPVDVAHYVDADSDDDSVWQHVVYPVAPSAREWLDQQPSRSSGAMVQTGCQAEHFPIHSNGGSSVGSRGLDADFMSLRSADLSPASAPSL
eukprot:628744-Amphidinium_carterae.1